MSAPPPRKIPIAAIQELLGDAVFIHCDGKVPTQKGWQKIRLDEMTAEYLARLNGNTGVSLGEASNGLCVVDCDDETFAASFLESNPHLAGTLQTRGARGRSFWLRFNGDYPRSSKLKLNGMDVGEFRSTGNQSIVSGIHPDTGKPYAVLVRAAALAAEFKSMIWPDGVTAKFLEDGSCGFPKKNPQEKSQEDARENDRNFPEEFSLYHNERVGGSENRQPVEGEFLKHCDDAIAWGVAGGGANHDQIIPRTVGRFLSLRGLKHGRHELTFARKNQLAERFYAKLKSKGLVTKSKSHYTNDMIATLNNPKMKASNPVPFALVRARSDETSDELRSAELLFEDENGRDENFILYLRWCYFLHVETNFGDWGISQRHVAKEIFGEEEPHYKTVGAWQEVLVGSEVIELVGEYVKGKLSRRYRWMWKGK